jgi:hypothetical protein
MPRAALLLAALIGLGPVTAPLVVRDLDGKTSTPLAPPPGAVHLLIFVSADCPISARYSPEINRIVRDYGARGVRTWLVYADAQAQPAAVRANLADFHPGLQATTVIDTGLRLTIATDAKVTPEAMVYTSAGRRYLGRIDDLYDGLAQPSRRTAAHHDLRNALDAVIAGRPVPAPITQPIGCFIERNVK